MSNKIPKVFVEGYQKVLEDVFRDLGWEVVRICDQDVDMVVLMGGADINPEFYNRKKHPRTSAPIPNFDKQTLKLIDFATERGISLVGICRGAQFINAIMGGDMWQDATDHTGHHHEVLDLHTGDVFLTNSLHHQIMIPTKEAEILAVTLEPLCKHAERVDEKGVIVTYDITPTHPMLEVEALYYDKFNALCYQAHPEYDHRAGQTRKYFYNLLQRKYPQYDYSVLEG